MRVEMAETSWQPCDYCSFALPCEAFIGKPPKGCACRTMFYCDVCCERRHWKTHRPYCLWHLLDLRGIPDTAKLQIVKFRPMDSLAPTPYALAEIQSRGWFHDHHRSNFQRHEYFDNDDENRQVRGMLHDHWRYNFSNFRRHEYFNNDDENRRVRGMPHDHWRYNIRRQPTQWAITDV